MTGIYIGEAVEVAVGDGFHDAVIEDVGGAFDVGDDAGGKSTRAINSHSISSSILYTFAAAKLILDDIF